MFAPGSPKGAWSNVLPRSFVGLAVALAALVPRVSMAALVCDAGAICPDNDNDGFAACGCAWSGTPCDCDDDDPTVFPGAPEACNSTKDNNCSGAVNEACPTKKGCLAGVCVPRCKPLDDFGCPYGSAFKPFADGTCLCEQEDCTIFGCPPGSTCDDSKACVPTCNASVKCPQGQICRGLGCVDPCAQVKCPDGAVCNKGRCLPSCACDPGSSCPQGQACDLTLPEPTCVEPACVGVRCPAATRCEHGACVDGCQGVVCPVHQVCRKVSVNGGPAQVNCVDLCALNPCKERYVCDWQTGACVPLPVPDPLAAPPESPDAGDPLEVRGAGWRCATAGLGRLSALTAITAGGALATFGLRRRRRGKKNGRSS
jgi:hypothetical protein